jgi:hypothetical protein
MAIKARDVMTNAPPYLAEETRETAEPMASENAGSAKSATWEAISR